MARAGKQAQAVAATEDTGRITPHSVAGSDTAPAPVEHEPLDVKSLGAGVPAMESMNPDNLAKAQAWAAEMERDARADMGFGHNSKLIGGYSEGSHRNSVIHIV